MTDGQWNEQIVRDARAAHANFVSIFDEAKAAAARGNCTRFEILRRQAEDLVQQRSAPFWRTDTGTVRNLVLPGFDINGDVAARVRHLRAIACSPPEPERLRLFIEAGGVAQRIPRRSFLGRELQGSGRPEVGQVSPGRSIGGGAFEAGFEINLDRIPFFSVPEIGPREPSPPRNNEAEQPKGVRFGGRIKFSETEGSSAPEVYQQAAGYRVLIPGPLGGASGFSLGAAPLNTVTGISYSIKAQEIGGEGVIWLPEVKLSEARAPAVFVSVGAGLGYTHGDIDERFGGTIPGFSRAFDYGFRYQTDRIEAILAGRISLRGEILGVPAETSVTVSARPGWASTDATANLAFTGFPASAATTSRNDFGVGFKAEAAASVQPLPNLSVGVVGSYERRPHFPTPLIDGTAPFQVRHGSASTYTVRGRLFYVF